MFRLSRIVDGWKTKGKPQPIARVDVGDILRFGRTKIIVAELYHNSIVPKCPPGLCVSVLPLCFQKADGTPHVWYGWKRGKGA